MVERKKPASNLKTVPYLIVNGDVRSVSAGPNESICRRQYLQTTVEPGKPPVCKRYSSCVPAFSAKTRLRPGRSIRRNEYVIRHCGHVPTVAVRNVHQAIILVADSRCCIDLYVRVGGTPRHSIGARDDVTTIVRGVFPTHCDKLSIGEDNFLNASDTRRDVDFGPTVPVIGAVRNPA